MHPSSSTSTSSLQCTVFENGQKCLLIDFGLFPNREKADKGNLEGQGNGFLWLKNEVVGSKKSISITSAIVCMAILFGLEKKLPKQPPRLYELLL